LPKRALSVGSHPAFGGTAQGASPGGHESL